ncbi:hypothetical protein GGH95_000365, partial [Coemansia sp. RSA 1836]
MRYASILYYVLSLLAIPATLAAADIPGGHHQAASITSPAASAGVEATVSSGNGAHTSPTPVCAWNGVQVNDPEPFSPLPAYAFKEMPRYPVGPGSIDSDVMRMVRRLSLKEKIGQMTQIEVGQIIDCNGELNRTAV